MNNTTKNDLSFDEVKLDYEALTLTAALAYSLCLQEIRRHISELDNADIKQLLEKNKDNKHSYNTTRHCTTERLLKTAKNLSIASDTYSALLDGQVRHSKTLVNVPEITEQTE